MLRTQALEPIKSNALPMKTWTIACLAAFLLAAPTLPAAAQSPVPNSFNVTRPQRPPGTSGYRTYHGKIYLYPGTVVEASTKFLKVQAAGGGAVTSFVVDEQSKIPQNLKVGSRITVDYGPTLETATYRVLQVKPVADKKKFPQAKGPLQP